MPCCPPAVDMSRFRLAKSILLTASAIFWLAFFVALAIEFERTYEQSASGRRLAMATCGYFSLSYSRGALFCLGG